MLNPVNMMTPEHLEEVRRDLVRISDLLSTRMTALEKGGISDILRFFNSVRDAYERMDEARKKIFAQIEHLSRDVIPERMSEEGITTMTVDGLRFTIGTRTSTSMTDKEAGYQWLVDNGYSDIIQQTVNASTLASFARHYLEDTGKDLPEFFKTTMFKYTSVTKT